MRDPIIRLREYLNMSQQRLAEELKLSRAMIYKYETNEVIPAFDTIRKLIKLGEEHGFKLTFEDFTGKKPEGGK